MAQSHGDRSGGRLSPATRAQFFHKRLANACLRKMYGRSYRAYPVALCDRKTSAAYAARLLLSHNARRLDSTAAGKTLDQPKTADNRHSRRVRHGGDIFSALAFIIAIQENSSIKISRENFTVQGKRPQLGCRPAREFDAAMWNFIRKICVGIFLDCYK